MCIRDRMIKDKIQVGMVDTTPRWEMIMVEMIMVDQAGTEHLLVVTMVGTEHLLVVIGVMKILAGWEPPLTVVAVMVVTPIIKIQI